MHGALHDIYNISHHTAAGGADAAAAAVHRVLEALERAGKAVLVNVLLSSVLKISARRAQQPFLQRCHAEPTSMVSDGRQFSHRPPRLVHERHWSSRGRR
jgi:hypothetical protein